MDSGSKAGRKRLFSVWAAVVVHFSASGISADPLASVPVPTSAGLTDEDRRFVIATAAAAALAGSDTEIPVTLTVADSMAVKRTVEAARLRAAVDALAFLNAATILLDREQARLDGALDSLDRERARLDKHRALLKTAADSLEWERVRMFDYASRFQDAGDQIADSLDSLVLEHGSYAFALADSLERERARLAHAELLTEERGRLDNESRFNAWVAASSARKIRAHLDQYALIYVRKNMLDAFIDSFIDSTGQN